SRLRADVAPHLQRRRPPQVLPRRAYGGFETAALGRLALQRQVVLSPKGPLLVAPQKPGPGCRVARHRRPSEALAAPSWIALRAARLFCGSPPPCSLESREAARLVGIIGRLDDAAPGVAVGRWCRALVGWLGRSCRHRS